MPKWYLQDTSMCAHQICLMATALDLGTCWIGSLDRDKAAKLLKLAPHEFLTTVLPIGYPKSETNGNPDRKELEKLVTYME